MKKKTLILSALLTMLAVTATAQTLPYQDTSLSFHESKGMSSTWDRQLIFDCATAVMFDHAAKYLWEVLKYMGIPVEELDYNFPKGDYYPTENPFA